MLSGLIMINMDSPIFTNGRHKKGRKLLFEMHVSLLTHLEALASQRNGYFLQKGLYTTKRK